jgi:hypothetical protein
MGKTLSRAASEFAKRPVSNTFIAFGGFLLTRSVSRYLDRLESEKRHRDDREYYPAPLGDLVELNSQSPEISEPEHIQEDSRAQEAHR